MPATKTRRHVQTRRTEHDIEVIKQAMTGLLAVEHPMTVRQLFYRLVSQGVIRKSDGEYQGTVVRLLSAMRRSREIPFGWIADNTRWQRKPVVYDDIEDALLKLHKTFRGNLWRDLESYVEIWCEKDALSGVIFEITSKWDVPLMVCKGYPSLSFLHGAANAIAKQGKPTFLYYFGDYDPSGMDISRFVEEGIREIAPEADLMFDRVAVNEDQIESLGLFTRPTKTSDSRSKNFGAESVEVDALPPAELRRMVETCINQHVDESTYSGYLADRNSSREIFGGLARNWWRASLDEANGDDVD